MKFFKTIATSIVISTLSLLLVSCSDSDSAQSSTNSSPLRAVSADKTTGLSKDAVNAQLEVGIRSPYQLISAMDPYVESLNTSELLKEELNAEISIGLSEIMPNASQNAKEELQAYLVNYYLKQI